MKKESKLRVIRKPWTSGALDGFQMPHIGDITDFDVAKPMQPYMVTVKPPEHTSHCWQCSLGIDSCSTLNYTKRHYFGGDNQRTQFRPAPHE